MRRTQLRDVPVAAGIAAYAFGWGRISRVALWPGMLLTVAGSHFSGELYVSADRRTIASVGRSGGGLNLGQLAAAAIAMALLLLVAGASGTVAWFVSGDLVIVVDVVMQAGWVLVGVLAVVAVLLILIPRRGRDARRTRLRPPRPYWTVTNLASLTRPAVPAMVDVDALLARLTDPGDKVVAVPRTAALRRIYRRFGFEPLPGSEWVLVKVV